MNLEDFRAELTAFLSETGKSRNALATEARVPQSQVSVWSNGGGKRYTENAKKVMSVIEKYRKNNPPPIPTEIEEAVRLAWDGDPYRVGLICDVLSALERHKNCV